jgi:hypothetical protein
VLGISLQKIAVFIGIVGTLWAIFRVARQFGKPGKTEARVRRPGRAVTQDMKECPVCGTYVAPAVTVDCGRPRCPYPRVAA